MALMVTRRSENLSTTRLGKPHITATSNLSRYAIRAVPLIEALQCGTGEPYASRTGPAATATVGFSPRVAVSTNGTQANSINAAITPIGQKRAAEDGDGCNLDGRAGCAWRI